MNHVNVVAGDRRCGPTLVVTSRRERRQRRKKRWSNRRDVIQSAAKQALSGQKEGLLEADLSLFA
jgi:hypothetical protein